MKYFVIWDISTLGKGLLQRYGVKAEDYTLWVFRNPRTKEPWTYAATLKGVSWREIREGHIRSAIADGWVPDELKWEDAT
jgi:hypothetical protein